MDVGVYGWRDGISIWQVYMPADADRDQYVKNCLNTSTVSIINVNGEVIHKVPVGKLAIQQIVFPADTDHLGSPVIIGNIPIHNQPVVLDILPLSEEFHNNEEGTWRLGKYYDSGEAEVTVRGKKGEVYISVKGKTGVGKVVIDVADANGNGELILNSNGTITLSTKDLVQNVVEQSIEDIQQLSETENPDKYRTIFTKNINGFQIQILKGEGDDAEATTILYDFDTGFSYLDSFGNKIGITSEGIALEDSFANKFTTTEDNVQIESSGNVLNLGQGTEKMVLGDTLAQLLKDLITEISIATTAAGPLLNAATIATYVAKVDTILSQYSNTE